MKALIVKLLVARDVWEKIAKDVPAASPAGTPMLGGLAGVPVVIADTLAPGDAFAEYSDGTVRRVMGRTAA